MFRTHATINCTFKFQTFKLGKQKSTYQFLLLEIASVKNLFFFFFSTTSARNPLFPFRGQKMQTFLDFAKFRKMEIEVFTGEGKKFEKNKIKIYIYFWKFSFCGFSNANINLVFECKGFSLSLRQIEISPQVQGITLYLNLVIGFFLGTLMIWYNL